MGNPPAQSVQLRLVFCADCAQSALYGLSVSLAPVFFSLRRRHLFTNRTRCPDVFHDIFKIRRTFPG